MIVTIQTISIQPLPAFGGRSQTAHRPGHHQLSSSDIDLYMNPHSRSVYTIIILSLFVCKVAWFKSQYKYCIQYRRLQLVEALFLSNASEPMTDLVLGRLVGIQGWDCRVVAPSNWHIDLDCRALLQAETTIQDKDKAVGTQFERNIQTSSPLNWARPRLGESWTPCHGNAWSASGRALGTARWWTLPCRGRMSWNNLLSITTMTYNDIESMTMKQRHHVKLPFKAEVLHSRVGILTSTLVLCNLPATITPEDREETIFPTMIDLLSNSFWDSEPKTQLPHLERALPHWTSWGASSSGAGF